MKKFKKLLRQFIFICLIILAVFGIGLSGGVPIPSSNKRKDISETNVELVEAEESETDSEEASIKG